jgi:hypothetical protein
MFNVIVPPRLFCSFRFSVRQFALRTAAIGEWTPKRRRSYDGRLGTPDRAARCPHVARSRDGTTLVRAAHARASACRHAHGPTDRRCHRTHQRLPFPYLRSHLIERGRSSNEQAAGRLPAVAVIDWWRGSYIRSSPLARSPDVTKRDMLAASSSGQAAAASTVLVVECRFGTAFTQSNEDFARVRSMHGAALRPFVNPARPVRSLARSRSSGAIRFV